MKNFCRKCCCAIFCCTCCRKTPLNVITEETRLLPKNNATRAELENEELYVFGAAPPDLRQVLLEGYGQKPVKKIVCGKSHCIILLNYNNKQIIGIIYINKRNFILYTSFFAFSLGSPLFPFDS